MKIEFNIKPYQACMYIKTEYAKEEIHQDYFYLNRDFVINKCFADGEEYDITDNARLESLETFDGYEVNKYSLPQSFQSIKIEYTGYLTGETGCCPYVRETISPDFTLIRFETFCYPMFCKDDIQNIIDFIASPADIDLTAVVPNEFIVASDADKIENYNADGMTSYVFKSKAFGFNMTAAKYMIKNLSVGKFYLLGEINGDQVEETMKSAYDYMNEHYGVRDISSDVNFVTIPNKLGSFAKPKTIFVDEITFESIENMAHIIHEFIHLGWNVPADNETQRIRFFCEAFTSYFQIRVMEYLLDDDLHTNIDGYKWQLDNGFDGNIPIIDFGKYEYGDLSYTIGARCLYELSEFVGLDVFEKATTVFLEKYKNTPVNMEIFCDEYIKLCNNPGLEQFFNDWIYTTNGPKSLIASC